MKLHFVPCGTGDMIHISLEEGTINLLIDSGYKKQCENDLIPLIHSIESFDLWIITHTDRDHIGGISKMLESNKNKELMLAKFKEVWFNFSPATISSDSGDITYEQGVLVRDVLLELGLVRDEDITIKMPSVELSKDTKLTLLSPTVEKLNEFKQTWAAHFYDTNIGTSGKDYHMSVDQLLESEFTEDDEVANGASISIFLESEGKKLLFLGDAHPSCIENALRGLGYTSRCKISIDCVKVSHHGSKKNTSPELLELIDCHRWVFTANGNGGKPSKETILRIASHYSGAENKTTFYINHDIPKYEVLFKGELETCQKLNFEIINLQDGVIEL